MRRNGGRVFLMRIVEIVFILLLVLIFSGTVAATDSNPLYDNSSQPAENLQTNSYAAVSDPTAPPSSTVNLVFIHHSTGENWLNDDNGGLGLALLDNNYFVSDTNYGWGPDSIGDRTDIGNWWEWFRGSESSTYLDALYNEKGQYSSYSRLSTTAAGENEIIMFKSCFPNSALQGSSNDTVPSISNNPLKGQSSGSDDHTIANAKGIYIDILKYFETRQDKLFIVITAPPLTDSTYASNARAFNQWLVNDWLKNYPYHNVFVFDFYNVLTSNGGNSNTNDLGNASGNHHRWWNNAVQHTTSNKNTLSYPSGDDHPSKAGNLKATSEFVPLLNYAYNTWKNNPSILTAHASPSGGLYNIPLDVVLNSSKPADIYYTTDGITPTPNSRKYTVPINIEVTTILRFMAVDDTGNQSPLYTENYTIDQTPTVTTTNPADNAVGVSLTSPITIMFSENIQAGANYSGIYIKNLISGATVSIASKTMSGNTLTIKQTNSRKSNTQYKVYIPAGAVKDAAGNPLAAAYTYTFTTTGGGTGDNIPPTITSTNPASGATGVSATSRTITITFSENIQQGTNFSGIYVKNLTTGKLTTIASQTTNGKILTIKQTYNRISKNSYQVYIPAGAVKDAAGNSLATSYSYQFKTV